MEPPNRAPWPRMHDRLWQGTQPTQQRPHLTPQKGSFGDLFDQASRPLHVACGQCVLDRLWDQPLLHVPCRGPVVQEYLAALEADAQIHCSAIEWVEQERWRSGRVVLIGDAAHASSPMMGQGGSLALEDAWVLAEALHSVDSVERALDAYVVRREPRVRWERQESQAAGESLRLPVAARNAALRARGAEMMEHRFRPLTARA
jgi:2-polyprenyl-6-methoxyphenol hydroxylase-like FAD-dependent oxidoreductase